jgi:predicted transcriptional regulator
MLVLKARNKKKESTLKTIPDEVIGEGGYQKNTRLEKKQEDRCFNQKVTEQLKFSKAKASRILGEMGSKGFIKRQKSGRDKVVSLQKETEKLEN